jgi:NAD(P)-dependent dehydrogenase (short-subunit alcohol dehydrogenase family)
MSAERELAGYVTGGGGDIGRASALAFARAGAAVLVADIDEEKGRETTALIEAAGGRSVFLKVDIADEGQVAAMVSAVLSEFGRIDFAINNAGIAPVHVTMDELDKADWDQNLRVNLTGTFLCMKHAIRAMLQSEGGAIVNIASVGAIKNVPLSHVYSAGKRGILALTGNAAIEYARHGIRVNSISPGYIAGQLARATEEADPAMTAPYKAAIPSGEFGTPDDIARAAWWLCDPSASGYVNGHNLVVDGGMTA